MFESTWLHSDDWCCYLFHAGFSLLFVSYWFSFIILCVLFCLEYKKWKKISLMHMPFTNLEILYARSFRFYSLTGDIAISSNCRAQFYKSYMVSLFASVTHLTGNIVISSDCCAQMYKSNMYAHFHVCHLTGNNA